MCTDADIIPTLSRWLTNDRDDLHIYRAKTESNLKNVGFSLFSARQCDLYHRALKRRPIRCQNQ